MLFSFRIQNNIKKGKRKKGSTESKEKIILPQKHWNISFKIFRKVEFIILFFIQITRNYSLCFVIIVVLLPPCSGSFFSFISSPARICGDFPTNLIYCYSCVRLVRFTNKSFTRSEATRAAAFLGSIIIFFFCCCWWWWWR